MLLRYILHIDPRWYQHACYALDLLLDGIGIAGVPADDATTADLVYAPTRPAGMAEHAVWIRAGSEADWNRPPAGVGWLDAMPVLYQGACPRPGSEAHNDVPADLLYATYALVGGLAGRPSPRRGLIPPAWRSWGRSGAPARPVVALYVDYLAARLKRRFGVSWAPVPRWPSGKPYAVVLTHDVGRPLAYHAPPSFYWRRWRVNVRRRAWWPSVKDLGGVGKALARERVVRELEDAPDAYVSNWEVQEAAWNVKSCFYVAAAVADPLLLPAGQGARRAALLDTLRHAIDAGWEVGLLASTGACGDPARLGAERQRLEAALGGYRLRGVRYGAGGLEQQGPAHPWHANAEAGLSYGTAAWLEEASIPHHGMIWPFLPFDRGNATRFEPYQILPAGEDFEQPGMPSEEVEHQLRRHIEQTFSYGGAVVLDRVRRQAAPGTVQGRGPLLARVMKDLLADDRIYWTTPGGLASWWSERRRRIAAFHIASPASRQHAPSAA